MRAIFDNRAVMPKDVLPHEMLKPFNLYHELSNNPKFADALQEVFEHNGCGKIAQKGRTEDEFAQSLVFGFAAEAWMNIHGAIPDTDRDFRDSFIPRKNRLVPIDVKAKESKHHSVWKTLEHMSEKVINDTHGCSDLEELYVWTFYADYHPRAGDLEFWKAYRRLDMPL